MANTIGWGEATVNNTIDWGQGFVNTNSWGASYFVSYSGETIIALTANAAAFKTRVLADGGTVESLQCITI